MLWVAIALIAGIVGGRYLPFIPVMVVLLLMAMVALACASRWREARMVVAMLLWMAIGVLRMEMARTEQPCGSVSYLQVAGRRSAETLTRRLQDAGVKDDALQLMASVLIGRRDMLSRSVRDGFRQTGTSHLLALSGMHLGILYALLHFLLFRWVRHLWWRWLVLPVMLSLIWAYTVVAGMPQSLVRAAVMSSVLCLGTSLSRPVLLLQMLGMAAVVMLLYDPLSLYDISFQLSFMAVFFIAALFGPVGTLMSPRNFFVRSVGGLLAVSLVAQLGTAPLGMYWFHTLPLASALAGLVMIPLVSLLLYAGFATLVCPCWLTGMVTTLLARFILWCNEHLQQVLGVFTIHNLYPSLPSVLLMYAFLLLFVLRVRTYLIQPG